MNCPPLVLCERYGTKFTASACERFRANTPERCRGCAGPVACEPVTDVVVTPVDAKTKKEDAVAAKKKANCLDCGELRAIVGRGLCGGCYGRNKAAGTLDVNFPSIRAAAKKAKAKKSKEPAEPVRLSDVPTSAPPAPQPTATSVPPVSSTIDAPVGPRPEKQPCCFIEFAPRDKSLYADLVKSAEHNRRDLASEILCRLDVLKVIQERA